MLKMLLVAFLILLGNNLFDIIGNAELSTLIQTTIGDHNTLIMAYGLVIILGVTCMTYVLAAFQLHSLLFLWTQLFLILSQLSVCLLVLGSFFCWFSLSINPWMELGAVATLPMISLAGASFAMRIFDFNHPILRSLYNFFLLQIIPFLLLMIYQGYFADIGPE
ncbi:MAG: hypothetical protein KJ950_14365 [Proteobacteria bacterium]|nr:hypothetical protein [Pseudomonadota bacterium]MBU1687893.1 hypothetical protein [Pseudomonadota bacterium]